MLKEGNLEGPPHLPSDKPVGKKTHLAEQRALARTQDKKNEFMTFGRRGRQLGDYKDVMRK